MDKMKKLILGILVITAFTTASCKDKNDDVIEKSTTVNKDTVKVNKFITDVFSDVYLWVDLINMAHYENNYKKYDDPFTLFKELRYKDDHWSTLTDDIEGMKGDFQGVSTSYGWNLINYLYSSNSDRVVSVVLFVYPGSPAEKAGVKRGDIITTINGKEMNTTTYLDLFYSSTITIQKGVILNQDIITQPATVSMTAVTMYNDPMQKDTVIVQENHKIGYLCYTEYVDKSEPELIRVFTKFKNQGVTDVVLDLRYNPGGYVRTAILLSSILAPASTVKNKDVFQKQVWNNYYTQVWNQQGDRMEEYFTDTLSVNMDLNKLYVLTSNGTASASEATVVGLNPFMDVILIGDTTTGKFVGGSLFSPEDIYKASEANYYKSIKNWGMYIMYFRYTNKSNTYFTTGLAPDIAAKEEHFDLKPFGDVSDPLLGRAIAQITGVPYVQPRAAVQLPSVKSSPELTVKRPLDGKLIDDGIIKKSLLREKSIE
jgi:C-terminal processing protease CtpA/Prc